MKVAQGSRSKRRGPYAGAVAGINIPADSDWTGPGQPTITIEYNSGFTGGVFAGYDYGMVRVEGEVRYLQADIDKFSALGVSLDAGADVNTWGYMLNGYYDFENSSALTPYLGVGIGAAHVEIKNASLLGYSIPGKDKDTEFAYQFIAGIDYSVSQQMMVGLSYRYFGTSDLKFEGDQEIEYGTHNILASIRFNF